MKKLQEDLAYVVTMLCMHVYVPACVHYTVAIIILCDINYRSVGIKLWNWNVPQRSRPKANCGTFIEKGVSQHLILKLL